MTNNDASPMEVTPVAAASLRAIPCDRDVLLPLLPVAGGLLPLALASGTEYRTAALLGLAL